MEIMKYKDYEGTATIDTERMVCCGKLIFIDDLVTYEAESASSLLQAFHDAVDDYIETCQELSKAPQRSLRGAFNVRVPPEMHRKAIRKSIKLDVSLNEIVVRAMDLFLNSKSNVQNVTNNFINQSDTTFRTLKIPASGSKPTWSKDFVEAGAGVNRGN